MPYNPHLPNSIGNQLNSQGQSGGSYLGGNQPLGGEASTQPPLSSPGMGGGGGDMWNTPTPFTLPRMASAL